MSAPTVLAVVPVLKDDPSLISDCLSNQTLPPTEVVFACGLKATDAKCHSLGFHSIYEPPRDSILVAPRVISAINACLSSTDLNKFTYILRVDADWRLPTNFIEANMPEGDTVGFYGSAIFIPVRILMELFGGRLPIADSENMIIRKLREAGYKLQHFRVPPMDTRPIDPEKTWKYFFALGKMGKRNEAHPWRYPLRCILFFIRERDIRGIFELIGYIL